jgi:glycosyltransferase involved in cell wall biosynthesis
MPGEGGPLFTVFTPTYNRAATLPRVYASLAAQTCRDFEWLVVDDGSTDGTAALVEGWRRAAPFPVRYLRQANAGKHVAHNRGVAAARGALFLTLDSDDACVPEALARFRHHWEAIPAAARGGFSAVTALCTDPAGQIVGDPFPRDILDSDAVELRYRYDVRGEKWGFQRTDVLRQFPFPEYAGERFITETVVWDAISRAYRTRFVNEPLRIYFTGEDGRDDQLSRPVHGASVRSPRGQLCYYRGQLAHNLRWFPQAPTEFVLAAAHYSRFALHVGGNPVAHLLRLPPGRPRILVALLSPLGLGAYLLDRSGGRGIAPLKGLERLLSH